jgi:hypothetical protein
MKPRFFRILSIAGLVGLSFFGGAKWGEKRLDWRLDGRIGRYSQHIPKNFGI